MLIYHSVLGLAESSSMTSLNAIWFYEDDQQIYQPQYTLPCTTVRTSACPTTNPPAMSSETDPTPPDVTDPAFVASVLDFTDYLYVNYSIDSSGLTAGIANYWSTEVISTTFFGVLSVCAGAAVIALITKPSTTRSKTILLTLIAAMYAVTALFLATSLYTFSHSATQAKDIGQSIANALGCLQDVVTGYRTDDPFSCATQSFSEPVVSRFAFAQPCASTVALVFNVAVGDAIVWWRAWAVWQGNMTVCWLGVVFVAATLAMGLVDSVDACGTSFAEDSSYLILDLLVTPGSLFEGDKYGIVVSVLSLITNVVATSLIAYKTWQHRRLIREHLKSQRRVSQVERTLCWLVESGVVYALIWIVVVIFEILPFEQFLSGGPVDTNDTILAFVSTFRPVVEGGLVPMIPYCMYRRYTLQSSFSSSRLTSRTATPSSSRLGSLVTVLPPSSRSCSGVQMPAVPLAAVAPETQTSTSQLLNLETVLLLLATMRLSPTRRRFQGSILRRQMVTLCRCLSKSDGDKIICSYSDRVL
ncbi:hypothetical protein C8Q80DRAFT_1192147 [Daedaleopsis nitida]|nr:hypothetical protein C8Q80DRAFT_1192147 [Daedaleopsis nitida]